VPLPAGISSTAALVTACPATATEDVAIQTGYLSGTDPLIAAQGLTVVGPLTVPVASPQTVLGTKLNYAVKFAPGANGTVGHSTVLDPTNDPLVTQRCRAKRRSSWPATAAAWPLPEAAHHEPDQEL